GRRGGSSAATPVHAFPRPGSGDPVSDGGSERLVEGRSVGPHPGLDRDVIVLGGRGIQVDASDDVVVDRVEDGEREPGALREVVSMPAKVGEILLERHAVQWGPVAVRETRSGPD